MAIASFMLVGALRTAAKNLEKNSQYQWGHMGSCNCGHLAQVITQHSASAIHASAMHGVGDWADQLREYCTGSGKPLDEIIDKLHKAGLSTQDLINLERLESKAIRNRKPEKLYWHHNKKEDVVLYLHLWADLLEEQLLKEASKSQNIAAKAAKVIVPLAVN